MLPHERTIHRLNAPAGATVVRNPSPILCGVVLIWSVLCMCGRLTELCAPRSDIAGLAFLTLYLFRTTVWDRPIIYGTFLVAMLIAGVRSSEAELALLWVVKLGAILSLTSSLVHRPKIYRAIFRGLQAAVLLNGALVILSLAGVPNLIVASGAGRAFTIVTFSGVLGRLGSSCLFYFAYLVMATRRVSVMHVAGLGACIATMWQDGSRTAAIMTSPVPIFILICLIKERRLRRIWIVALLSLVAVYKLGGVLLDNESDNPLVRIAETFENLFTGKFEEVDESRYELAQYAMDLVRQEPIFGNGFRTALIRGGKHEDGFQVVHNAYLQVWAETGLLGLIPFAAIMWGWIWRALPSYKYIGRIEDDEIRAFYYNSLFLLFYSGLCYMTHPLGTECTDWLVFACAYASIYTLPVANEAIVATIVESRRRAA